MVFFVKAVLCFGSIFSSSSSSYFEKPIKPPFDVVILRLFPEAEGKVEIAELMRDIVESNRPGRELVFLTNMLEESPPASITDLAVDMLSMLNLNIMANEESTWFTERERQSCISDLMVFAASEGYSSDELKRSLSELEGLETEKMCARVESMVKSGNIAYGPIDRFFKVSELRGILELHAEHELVFPSRATEMAIEVVRKQKPSNVDVMNTLDLMSDAIEAGSSIPLGFADIAKELGVMQTVFLNFHICAEKGGKHCWELDDQLRAAIDNLGTKAASEQRNIGSPSQQELFERVSEIDSQIGLHLREFLNRAAVLSGKIGDEEVKKNEIELLLSSVIDSAEKMIYSEGGGFSLVGLADLISVSLRTEDLSKENIKVQFISFAFEFKRRFGIDFSFPSVIFGDSNYAHSEKLRKVIEHFTLFGEPEWTDYDIAIRICDAQEEHLDKIIKILKNLVETQAALGLVSPGGLVQSVLSSDSSSRLVDFLSQQPVTFPENLLELADKATRINEEHRSWNSFMDYNLDLCLYLPRVLFQSHVDSGIIAGEANEELRDLIDEAANMFMNLVEVTFQEAPKISVTDKTMQKIELLFDELISLSSIKSWIGPDDVDPSWFAYWFDNKAYNARAVLQENRRIANLQVGRLEKNVIENIVTLVAQLKQTTNLQA